MPDLPLCRLNEAVGRREDAARQHVALFQRNVGVVVGQVWAEVGHLAKKAR